MNDPFSILCEIFCDASPVFDINPASGLPMIDGTTGVDVAGNPYGMSSEDVDVGIDCLFDE